MSRVAVIFSLVCTIVAAYKTYDGYRVIQVTPASVDQLRALHQMNNALGFEVDFWKSTGRIGKYADIMVSPEQMDKVMAYLNKYNMKTRIVVANVARLVERSMNDVRSATAFTGDDPNQFALDQYHSLADINAWLQAVQTAYSSFVSIGSFGTSLQNRQMWYLKIGTPSGQSKPALFIDAGIHAREWVAPATALYTIKQLVDGYSTTYKQLLDAIDIYVAPSINPDGYEYSRTSDRMWRKTRSGPRQGCYGVDPNRNYAFHWGELGVSTSPCSEIYCGPSPFSENSTINIGQFLRANAASIKGYLTLHSYGTQWIYPWGYQTGTYPPDVAELRALGLQAKAAIQAIHGTQYVVDDSADSLYPAAGASDDYSKSLDIKWVYTVELRPGNDLDDDHQYGFDLPPQFIIPTAEEAFAGLMVVANRIMTGPN